MADANNWPDPSRPGWTGSIGQMTDPIRDALREAGEAARDSFACKPCGEPCTLPPCRCADDAAAAAVAAFLRHYSKRSPTALIYGPAVADDVEHAAKEGA